MIGGIVLCGGESRRMGRSKAWLPFGPEMLLQRVVRLVGSAASPVVVVAAPGQDLPALLPGILIIRDPVAHLGPLRGLESGLEALPDSCEFAYATATDAPFLAPGWIDRLAGRIGDADAAIPFIDGRHQPLSALYRRSKALTALETLGKSGESRLLSLIDTLHVRIVPAEELAEVDPTLATVRNLNFLADYEEALWQMKAGGDLNADDADKN